MVLINLTGEVPKEEVCCYCEKPFQHYMKTKRNTNPNELAEMQMVTCHPACLRTHKKMQNIKNKIMKTKTTLHNLRTCQLNLEFEAFMSGHATLDQETDEIFLLLKQKGIIG